MPYSMNHYRRDGGPRTGTERRGHRTGAMAAGRTSLLGAERGSAKSFAASGTGATRWAGPRIWRRALLLKLERSGHILLPPRQRPSYNGFRNRRVPVVALATEPIHGLLPDLRPLAVSTVAPSSADRRLFDGLLAGHHYLGHRNTVGENLRYLVRDRMGRPVACALFGSAAWKCADRDAFIG